MIGFGWKAGDGQAGRQQW